MQWKNCFDWYKWCAKAKSALIPFYVLLYRNASVIRSLKSYSKNEPWMKLNDYREIFSIESISWGSTDLSVMIDDQTLEQWLARIFMNTPDISRFGKKVGFTMPRWAYWNGDPPNPSRGGLALFFSDYEDWGGPTIGRGMELAFKQIASRMSRLSTYYKTSDSMFQHFPDRYPSSKEMYGPPPSGVAPTPPPSVVELF